MRWRQKLAEVAGFPPLMLMEGFYDPKDWWAYTGTEKLDLAAMAESEECRIGHHWMNHNAACGIRGLPISWDVFAADPLVKLLYHSDCDGEIAAEDCEPLAERLMRLLPKLPDENAGGHIGNWREKTLAFIVGLRHASAAGEAVRFH
jgi:hypothetical protein